MKSNKLINSIQFNINMQSTQETQETVPKYFPTAMVIKLINSIQFNINMQSTQETQETVPECFPTAVVIKLINDCDNLTVQDLFHAPNNAYFKLVEMYLSKKSFDTFTDNLDATPKVKEFAENVGSITVKDFLNHGNEKNFAALKDFINKRDLISITIPSNLTLKIALDAINLTGKDLFSPSNKVFFELIKKFLSKESTQIIDTSAATPGVKELVDDLYALTLKEFLYQENSDQIKFVFDLFNQI